MVGDAVPGRLAELTIALSLATDPGAGQPLGPGLRTCSLSLSVAEALGLEASDRSWARERPRRQDVRARRSPRHDRTRHRSVPVARGWG